MHEAGVKTRRRHLVRDGGYFEHWGPLSTADFRVKFRAQFRTLSSPFNISITPVSLVKLQLGHEFRQVLHWRSDYVKSIIFNSMKFGSIYSITI